MQTEAELLLDIPHVPYPAILNDCIIDGIGQSRDTPHSRLQSRPAAPPVNAISHAVITAGINSTSVLPLARNAQTTYPEISQKV